MKTPLQYLPGAGTISEATGEPVAYMATRVYGTAAAELGPMMAAAPDVTAALVELLAAGREATATAMDRSLNDRAINRLIDAEKAADAVIAKAKGTST